MKIWIHGLQESVRLQTTNYWLVSQNDIYWQTSNLRGCRGHMVVGFTTTYEISAYHHWHEFESCVGEVYSIQHYVIKFVSNLWQVRDFLQVLWFPPHRGGHLIIWSNHWRGHLIIWSNHKRGPPDRMVVKLASTFTVSDYYH
jgi:hypothetical protein